MNNSSNLTAQLNDVSNHNLFELFRAEQLDINEYLSQFLQKNPMPWNALGKTLTLFIEECLSRIPKAERIQAQIPEGVFFENKEQIFIDKNAIIEPGAYIAGPTYIEAGAVIRHGAYIRGSVYIAKKALVGHTTECKGSLFLPHAKAAHFNYVGDSILGHDCNLGAGTKLANLKLNHGNVFLKIDKQKIDSGLKKFGAILGNRAQTGCNSVTNPGTIMCPESLLLPNKTALGIIKKHAPTG